jgi:DNA polymerase-3 subunit epsilon
MIALFFDTETTGVPDPNNPDFKPAVVQLAAVLQDLENGRILAELNLIANLYPGVDLPQAVVDLHGITHDMTVKYGVDPKLIDINFGKLVKMADVLVAHNIQFDLGIIKDNMPLSHSVIDFKHHFCTMLNNLPIVKVPRGDKPAAYPGMTGVPEDSPFRVPSLITTYKHYFNDEYDGAHDAMADVRACRDVFLAMITAGWFEIIQDPDFKADVIRETAKYGVEAAFPTAGAA